MSGLISQAAAQSGLKPHNAQAPSGVQARAKNSINVMLSNLLDSENYRKRFDELLGKRAPQFISSLVSLVNADAKLQKAFRDAPVTVIQSALKAATYDLPIDPQLGYAYIVPFNNRKQDGSIVSEAAYIPGYKGLIQLALRTGVYKTLNVIDIREGELKRFDRLTEEKTLEFVEDDVKRAKLPIVGYMGYFRLLNGMEKTIYRTVEQINEHELANRKGDKMGKGWRENFDAMCRKTVLRELIGKWGLMSIEYRSYDEKTLALAQAIAEEEPNGDRSKSGDADYTVNDGKVINTATGEVVGNVEEADDE